MPVPRALASERHSWLIYGAYGFTGRLVVEEALRRGHRPILAGRNKARLDEIAAPHGLSAVAVSLDDAAAIRAAIDHSALVLNAAGPFAETGPQLIEACFDTGAAYVDLAGEFHHLLHVGALDARAGRAGIALLTGAGFGVTYGECLACRAVELMPDATRLRLSVAAANAQTTTAVRRSVVDVLARGNYAIEQGRIRRRALAHELWTIRSGDTRIPFASAPLGELAALHRTTGIADVVVGLPMPMVVARTLRLTSPLIHAGLRIPAVRWLAGRGQGTAMTSATEPPSGWRSRIWVEAANARGYQLRLQVDVGEGYAATAQAALANVEALLSRRLAGAFTPGLAFGAQLLKALPEAAVIECDSQISHLLATAH